MRVVIHASLDFRSEMEAEARALSQAGYDVVLPELTRYQHIRDELGDEAEFTRIKTKLTRQNMANVESSDCLLIFNYTHRGIINYIGGNSFLEMVIAFYLSKPILLLNSVPDGLSFSEEAKALEPIVCGSSEKILNELGELRIRRGP